MVGLIQAGSTMGTGRLWLVSPLWDWQSVPHIEQMWKVVVWSLIITLHSALVSVFMLSSLLSPPPAA